MSLALLLPSAYGPDFITWRLFILVPFPSLAVEGSFSPPHYSCGTISETHVKEQLRCEAQCLGLTMLSVTHKSVLISCKIRKKKI